MIRRDLMPWHQKKLEYDPVVQTTGSFFRCAHPRTRCLPAPFAFSSHPFPGIPKSKSKTAGIRQFAAAHGTRSPKIAPLAGPTGWPHWLAPLAGPTGWPHWLAPLAGPTGWSHWLVPLAGPIGWQHAGDQSTTAGPHSRTTSGSISNPGTDIAARNPHNSMTLYRYRHVSCNDSSMSQPRNTKQTFITPNPPPLDVA